MSTAGASTYPLTRPTAARLAVLLAVALGVGTGRVQAAPLAQGPRPPEPAGAVRTDRDGNPLPDGLIARLGTLTLRDCCPPMAFTPDGKYFVCSSWRPQVTLSFFEPVTGRRVFDLGPGSAGSHVQFSPDGKRLACPVGGNGNVVWDLDRRNQLFTFEGSQAGFSADSARLITVSYSGKGHCRVLDGSSGKLLHEQRLEADISWAEVVPGGTQIVFRDKTTGRAVLFDWSKRMPVAAFACEEGLGATVSPDGKSLAVADRSGVRLLDLATGKQKAHWKQRTEGRAVFAPDGRRLAWTGYDNTRGIAYPWLVDVAGGPPRRVGLPTNNFAPPCFTPDGKALVVLVDGNVPEWRDVETGRDLRPLRGHAGSVFRVLPLADGKHLLSHDHNRLLVWEHFAGKLVHRYPDDLPDGETALHPTTPAGAMLTVHSASGTLRLRDLVSGRELLKLEGNHGFIGPAADPVTISGDGKTAALVSKDGDIRIYDLATGKLRRTFDPEAAVWDVELSDDGRHLEWVTQSRKGGDGPFILDTHTGKESAGKPRFSVKPRDPWTLLRGEDLQKRLGEMKLVDAQGKPIDRTWAGRVFAARASPDGRLLVLSYIEPGSDNFGQNRYGLSLWDLATGKPFAQVKPKWGTVRFAPDSRLLVTATREGVIDVWEIATGQKRLSLKGHLPGEIHVLEFLQDHRSLVSAGSDTQVLLWDLTGRAPDGVWRTVTHRPQRQRELWDALADLDGVLAHRAIWELAADPAGTVSFLARHVRPAAAADAGLVARLIDNLDSPVFTTRTDASAELARLGEAVVPALRAAARKPSSLEQSRRLQSLLEDLGRPDLTGERLRAVRSVEVLELIGTAEARGVLEELAKGLTAVRLTREAQAALRR